MSKRNTTTITFSLSMELVNRFKKLAMLEGKTESQLFQDMFDLYEEIQEEREWQELRRYGSQKAKELGITSEEDVVRLIHEFRAERKAGKHSDSLSEQEIEKLIREIKTN